MPFFIFDRNINLAQAALKLLVLSLGYDLSHSALPGQVRTRVCVCMCKPEFIAKELSPVWLSLAIFVFLRHLFTSLGLTG